MLFYNLRIFDLFHLEIKNKLLFRIAHRDFRHVTLNIKSIFFGLNDEMELHYILDSNFTHDYITELHNCREIFIRHS